jgi:hypothetical protein
MVVTVTAAASQVNQAGRLERRVVVCGRVDSGRRSGRVRKVEFGARLITVLSRAAVVVDVHMDELIG